MNIKGFIDTYYIVAGALSMIIIFAFCCWSIIADKVNDGLFGRIMYVFAALSALAWILHMRDGFFPHRTTTTLLGCLAVLMVRRVFITSSYWARIRCWWYMQVRQSKSRNAARSCKK